MTRNVYKPKLCLALKRTSFQSPMQSWVVSSWSFSQFCSLLLSLLVRGDHCMGYWPYLRVLGCMWWKEKWQIRCNEWMKLKKIDLTWHTVNSTMKALIITLCCYKMHKSPFCINHLIDLTVHEQRNWRWNGCILYIRK